MKKRGLKEADFYDKFIEKRAEFEKRLATPSPNRRMIAISSRGEEKPTREEIRDAMMDECGNYYILQPVCKAAVEIAYLLD